MRRSSSFDPVFFRRSAWHRPSGKKHDAVHVSGFADVLERGIALAKAEGGISASVRLVEERIARSPPIEARFVPGGRDEHAGSSLDDVRDGRVLHHRRLVRNEGRVIGVLEVGHGLPTQAAILRAALAEEAVVALGLGVLAGVLALGLGPLRIGAPLARCPSAPPCADP